MPEISASALKSLRALPEPLRRRATEIIRRLDVEPALGKKLKGKLAGSRSVRLGRSHRIIYTSTSTAGTVRVTAIRPRRDAYR